MATSPHPRQATYSQAGFTLIEMLVAMIILAIFLAAATSVLIDGFSSTDHAIVKDKSSLEVNDAMDQIGTDLRRARAYQRDPVFVRSLVALRQWAITGTDVLSYGTGVVMDMQDIKVATADKLVFTADVFPEYPAPVVSSPPQPTDGRPIPECVTIEGITAGTTWGLRRTVSDYALTGAPASRCSSGSLMQTWLIRPRPVSVTTPAPSPLFSYERTYNSNLAATPLSPSDCKTDPLASAASDADRRQITSVTIDLHSVVFRQNAMGETEAKGTIGIRTRMNYDYQFALGCAR